MEQSNIVDNSAQVGYNDDNVGNEIVVDTAAMPPLNDVTCGHRELIPDYEDTIGDAVYHGCTNVKCGRGWYIRLT